jgi:hypothetical protein
MKTCLFFILSSFLVYGNAALDSVKSKIDNEKTNVLQFCKMFAPAYVPLLETHYSSPNSWNRYVDGKPSSIVFNSNIQSDVYREFETIIHESTHQKNSNEIIFVSPEISFYTTADQRTLINHFFKSEQIASLLPSDVNEKVFRFNTYIGLNSGVTSNVKGIWGLMDEYTAYQNGCRASIMAYDNALLKGDTTMALTCIEESVKTYFAYYEFRLFIGAYLKYAALYHSELYKDILEFTALRKAFALNTILFEANVYNIQHTKNRLKRHNAHVEWLYNYYQEKYVAPTNACLVPFQEYLSVFSKPFESEYAWAKSQHNIAFKLR